MLGLVLIKPRSDPHRAALEIGQVNRDLCQLTKQDLSFDLTETHEYCPIRVGRTPKRPRVT